MVMMCEVAYMGVKGTVVAVDVATGKERWRTYVRSSTITNVAPCDKVVLVYAKGHLFGLDKENGRILWENQLEGLGYGYGIIGVEGGQSAAATSAAAQQQQAAAASGAAVAASAAATAG